MKELIKSIYKSMATSFIRRIEWRKMIQWLQCEEGEKILDVACGDGTLSFKLAEKGCKVYGIDISKDSIEAAKSFCEKWRMNCEFVVGNAENLPYPDE